MGKRKRLAAAQSALLPRIPIGIGSSKRLPICSGVEGMFIGGVTTMHRQQRDPVTEGGEDGLVSRRS